MENVEETMGHVIGICSSCANLFMCEGAEEDENENVIIRLICLVINEEVDTPIANCSHFVDREEGPLLYNDPFK